jgi:ankyrin repeat protein
MKRLAEWFNNQEKQEKNFKTGTATLMNACVNGQYEVVKMMMPNFDVNTKNEGGETLVMMAAKQGHVDIVDLLIKEYGADLTLKMDVGGNVITSAARGTAVGKSEMTLNYLVQPEIRKLGADIDAKLEGYNALMMAAKCGDLAIIDILCNAKADIQAVCETEDKTYKGLTALQIAKEDGRTSSVWRLERQLGEKTHTVRVQRNAAGVAMSAN